MPLVELIKAETSKKKGMIKYLEGASIFVRVEDAQLPNTVPTAFVRENVRNDVLIFQTKASVKYIPAKTKAKYEYDPVKVRKMAGQNAVAKMVPPKLSEKALEKEMNTAFAKVRVSMFGVERLFRKWISPTCHFEQVDFDRAPFVCDINHT